MQKRTAQARARRGAAFLDEKLGRSWRRKIKRQRLNMDSGGFPARGESCGCILAQLAPKDEAGWGHYTPGAARVGLDDPWGEEAKRLGFFDDDEDAYPLLTEAWLEELKR